MMDGYQLDKPLKIDNRHPRLRAGPQVRPQRLPRFGPDDLEAVLDELRAQRRARPPVGTQQDDIGWALFVHGILRLAQMKPSFIGT